MAERITSDNIFNYLPFNSLYPDVHGAETWRDREIPGWGNVHLPALSGEGCLLVWSIDRVEEYIEEFNEKFGEYPIFELNPDGVWFNKCRVVNDCFLKFKEEKSEMIRKGIEAMGTAE